MPLDTLLAILSVLGVSALSSALGALAVIAWRPAPKPGHRLTVILPEGCDPTGEFRIEGIQVDELAFEHFPFAGEYTVNYTEPASAEAMGAIPTTETN